MTGSYASVRIVTPPAANTAADMMLTLVLDGQNHYRMYLTGPTLRFEKKLGGTNSSIGSPVTFDLSAHAYWRVRHNVPTDQIVFETAGSNGAWTVRAATTRELAIGNLKVELKAGTSQSEANAPGVVRFDDLSVVNLVTPPAAETVFLTEHFTGAGLDTAKWVVDVISGSRDPALPLTYGGTFKVGPLLQGTTASHYNGIASLATVDLSSAYAWVQMVQAPATGTTADMMLSVVKDNNNHYRIFVEAGLLRMEKKIGNTKTALNAITLRPTEHAFWRIRHDAASDQMVFETAPAHGDWSRHAAVARELAITALRVELKGGTYQAEAAAPGFAVFDHVRVARPQ